MVTFFKIHCVVYIGYSFIKLFKSENVKADLGARWAEVEYWSEAGSKTSFPEGWEHCYWSYTLGQDLYHPVPASHP